jgi:hypothetical protein
MRFSVILAILAREIAKHIFQPTYIAPMEDISLPGFPDRWKEESIDKKILFRY